MAIRLTLLELVQGMLAAIDAENVTSVGQTEEAGQCVSIVNRCYEDMLSTWRWKHLRTYANLVNNSSNLHELNVPDNALAIDPDVMWYKDSANDSGAQKVWYLNPTEFLTMTLSRNLADSGIIELDGIRVHNDKIPQFFTSDDDETLQFDAVVDSSNGLAAARTQTLAWILPSSRLVVDAEVPDLPRQAFPALEDFCIGTAVKELKGDTQAAQLTLREFKRKMANLSRNARVIDKSDDTRDHIVPRRRSRRTLINTGQGFI
jgi:hypothetical protein